MSLIGRSVCAVFLCGFALLACGKAGPGEVGDTEAGEGGTTGEPMPDPLSGVADLHLHMFAEEAFGGGWFHGEHAGEGADALAPCDGGMPGDHGRLRSDLAPLLGTCEDVTLEELASMVPLVGAITGGGG